VNRAPIEIGTSDVPSTDLAVTPPATADGVVDPRPAALRRMRLLATLLLAAMAAIFVATTVTHFEWPWIPYLRAFAEAGMVGACADWFAVVALFRRPLGLPIPHTGIVPANKDRIGKALGRFITNNFLTAAVMNERMARVDIVGSFARWVGEPANAKRLAHYTTLVLPRISRSLPGDRIGETLGQLAQQALQAIPAGPLASKMLAVIWAHGEAQTLLAQAIDYSAQWLAANKDYLTLKIAQQSTRWIPKWIDKIIAEKVLNGMLSTLAEMRDPAHPWRIEMRKSVEKLIADLASDPAMRDRIDAMKSELLAHPLVIEQAKTLWNEIETGLSSGVPRHLEAVGTATENALLGVSSWLQEDADRKERLNRRIRAMTQQFLLLYRVEIGAYIERVVHNWDSATLVDRLELQVGKDLQYIRINGTLVGGLVGLLIFIASKWIGAL
jgi:uncharacterized membrane-anchored protein YjiN (DUF445 family)